MINKLVGDVTTPQGSGQQPATIANDAVTFAKMQNSSAASRIIGRGSASGAGDFQEITLGSNLTMTGTVLSAADTDTGITQLTGDVTAGPGSGSQVATLANTAVTPSGYTLTALTVDAKGRITAAANGNSGNITTALGFTPLDAAASSFAGSAAKWTTGRTITLTGDVTGVSGAFDGSAALSFAATIANNTVTYAKMQDISATSRILGRKTAAAGDTEECTLSEILDFIGSAAQGDILYRGSSTWARLAAGTAGQYLQTNGAAAPTWATPAPIKPNFSANRNASDQTISSGSFVKIQFNNEVYDVGSCYDSATNYRFTPTTAGKYLITVGVSISITSSGTPASILSIFKNGSEHRRGNQLLFPLVGTNSIGLQVSSIVQANGSSDYFETFIFQNSGVNATLAGDITLSYVQASYISD